MSEVCPAKRYRTSLKVRGRDHRNPTGGKGSPPPPPSHTLPHPPHSHPYPHPRLQRARRSWWPCFKQARVALEALKCSRCRSRVRTLRWKRRRNFREKTRTTCLRQKEKMVSGGRVLEYSRCWSWVRTLRWNRRRRKYREKTRTTCLRQKEKSRTTCLRQKEKKKKH